MASLAQLRKRVPGASKKSPLPKKVRSVLGMIIGLIFAVIGWKTIGQWIVGFLLGHICAQVFMLVGTVFLKVWNAIGLTILNDQTGFAFGMFLGKLLSAFLAFLIGYEWGSSKDFSLFNKAGELLGIHVGHPYHDPKHPAPSWITPPKEGEEEYDHPYPLSKKWIRKAWGDWGITAIFAVATIIGGAYYLKSRVVIDVSMGYAGDVAGYFKFMGEKAAGLLENEDINPEVDAGAQPAGTGRIIVPKAKATHRVRTHPNWKPEGFLFPLEGQGYHITSAYKRRSYGYHDAFDIFPPQGTKQNDEFPVHAVKAGSVYITPRANACGVGMIITHDDGSSALYCHMKEGSLNVGMGQRVEQGQRLGLVGATGHVISSTNAANWKLRHLHLAIRNPDGDTVPMNELWFACPPPKGGRTQLPSQGPITCE